jgi:branched-chain amino acid transport system substrate-binding protein
VFNTIVPPGVTPFLAQLHAGFPAGGGRLVCTYFGENVLDLVPVEHVEGLYGRLDCYRDVQDPFSIDLLNRYEAPYPGSALFTAGSACTGTYRALRCGSVRSTRRDHCSSTMSSPPSTMPASGRGPGGPAEMVPGQHHGRVNMYLAQSQDGTFTVVKSLGHIDRSEPMVPMGRSPRGEEQTLVAGVRGCRRPRLSARDPKRRRPIDEGVGEQLRVLAVH